MDTRKGGDAIVMQKNYEKNNKLMISIFLFVAYVKENLCNLIYRQLLNAHHTKKKKGRILVSRCKNRGIHVTTNMTSFFWGPSVIQKNDERMGRKFPNLIATWHPKM